MDELRKLGNFVLSEGWEPLLCIASEHGKCLSYHIYAAKFNENKDKDRCALFVFSDDQRVVRDDFREFKNFEEGNKHFMMMRLFTEKVRNVVVHMDKLMEGVA